MWAIGVRFLRGVCVATDTGQWDEAEWPPHPARLNMALAATYFETCEPRTLSDIDHKRRRALEWLEQQAAPTIMASSAETRTPVTVFVPVNDSTRSDQLFANTRSRQPRHFPTSIPHRDELYYVWNNQIESGEIADGLELVAFDVSRLGHSSSLVQVWIEHHFDRRLQELAQRNFHQWTPASDGELESTRLRVASAGSLRSYEASYNAAAIEEFVALAFAVKQAKGKEEVELRKDLSERFPDGMPASQRPQSALPVAYQLASASAVPPAASYFDSDLMILSLEDSPTIGLESTLQLSGAVRKRLHDAYEDRSSPEWLGGHKADGSPTEKPHVAIVPLPFVDHGHADGHLLGIGIAFPRDVPRRERAVAIRDMFERSEDLEEWVLNLRLNNFRQLTSPSAPHVDILFVREQRLTPPRSLRAQTWTSACSVWETVTPIVLDRFPKKDRIQEREAWNKEVAEIVAKSCQNIGLPEPWAIHIHQNAFVRGVPKSRPESGFPTMPGRSGKPSRYQIHARIEFGVPVIGPVILGAGRFVGYGFCRPNITRCKQRRGAQ